MKIFVLAIMLSFFLAPNMASAHGGGCKKSSPQGQCCHTDRKTGVVHCH